MSPTLTSTGMGHFKAKFAEKGCIGVSHILILSGRDMG